MTEDTFWFMVLAWVSGGTLVGITAGIITVKLFFKTYDKEEGNE